MKNNRENNNRKLSGKTTKTTEQKNQKNARKLTGKTTKTKSKWENKKSTVFGQFVLQHSAMIKSTSVEKREGLAS